MVKTVSLVLEAKGSEPKRQKGLLTTSKTKCSLTLPRQVPEGVSPTFTSRQNLTPEEATKWVEHLINGRFIEIYSNPDLKSPKNWGRIEAGK